MESSWSEQRGATGPHRSAHPVPLVLSQVPLSPMLSRQLQVEWTQQAPDNHGCVCTLHLASGAGVGWGLRGLWLSHSLSGSPPAPASVSPPWSGEYMLLTVQGGRLKRGGVFGEGGPFEVSARPSHGHPGGCQSSGASLVAPCPTAAGGSMDSVQTQGWGPDV